MLRTHVFYSLPTVSPLLRMSRNDFLLNLCTILIQYTPTVPYKVRTVYTMVRTQYCTTTLISSRITIVRLHQKFHTFINNPITRTVRWQTIAGLLSYWYTLTELNSKYALENAPGLLLTKSGFCPKSVVFPYHFVLTRRTFASARASRRAIDCARPVST